jgi:hypothetical protein
MPLILLLEAAPFAGVVAGVGLLVAGLVDGSWSTAGLVFPAVLAALSALLVAARMMIVAEDEGGTFPVVRRGIFLGLLLLSMVLVTTYPLGTPAGTGALLLGLLAIGPTVATAFDPGKKKISSWREYVRHTGKSLKDATAKDLEEMLRELENDSRFLVVDRDKIVEGFRSDLAGFFGPARDMAKSFK